MEGLTPHHWAGHPVEVEPDEAVAIIPGYWHAPGFDPAAAEAMNAAIPRFITGGRIVGTKAAVAAASLLRFGHAVTAARSFVPDTELPDFDFPTWRVRHRPYDYETDGC